jgi:hypothetical protein
MAGIVDWLQGRGYWMRGSVADHDSPPTHLFLTGGKASVPDDSASLFLNAYANAIVRGDTPSVSECRTPVFRMFVDLDVKLACASDHEKLRDVVLAVAACAPSFFEAQDPTMVVLAAPLKTCADHVKSGTHLVWPCIFADSATALTFRNGLVSKLKSKFGDALFANNWDSIVDSCVYKSSGLRMAWSHKGAEARPYIPVATVDAAGRWTVVEAPTPLTVPFAREWVRKTSIRRPGSLAPTPLQHGIVVTRSAAGGAGHNVLAESVGQYASALGKIDEILPIEHAGQKFVGVMRLDNCFILRSTSRYCANLGRSHNSNNVYFVLTRRGVSQHCYCRCETTEGRKHGMCRDFAGPLWSVTPDVIREFFGDDDAEKNGATTDPAGLPILAPLPSCQKSFQDLDSLLRLSRPAAPKGRRRKAAART